MLYDHAKSKSSIYYILSLAHCDYQVYFIACKILQNKMWICAYQLFELHNDSNVLHHLMTVGSYASRIMIGTIIDT